MGNGDIQGDAPNGSTSQCAVASMDSDVESPKEEDKEWEISQSIEGIKMLFKLYKQ